MGRRRCLLAVRVAVAVHQSSGGVTVAQRVGGDVDLYAPAPLVAAGEVGERLPGCDSVATDVYGVVGRGHVAQCRFQCPYLAEHLVQLGVEHGQGGVRSGRAGGSQFRTEVDRQVLQLVEFPGVVLPCQRFLVQAPPELLGQRFTGDESVQQTTAGEVGCLGLTGHALGDPVFDGGQGGSELGQLGHVGPDAGCEVLGAHLGCCPDRAARWSANAWRPSATVRCLGRVGVAGALSAGGGLPSSGGRTRPIRASNSSGFRLAR